MSVYHILTVLHVLGGSIALIAGLFAIVFKKGRGRHSRSGNIYYLSMYAVAISAMVMCFLKWNPFLLCIGVFSLYLTYSGKRAVKYWSVKEHHNPVLYEKLPFFAAMIVALIMIGYPVSLMIKHQKIFFSLFMLFGLMMLVSTIVDIRMFRVKENFTPRNKSWLLKHIAMMGGAYIATITAFLVVNIKVQPFWLPWVLPTVVGSIIITLAINKWDKKLK